MQLIELNLLGEVVYSNVERVERFMGLTEAVAVMNNNPQLKYAIQSTIHLNGTVVLIVGSELKSSED